MALLAQGLFTTQASTQSPIPLFEMMQTSVLGHSGSLLHPTEIQKTKFKIKSYLDTEQYNSIYHKRLGPY